MVPGDEIPGRQMSPAGAVPDRPDPTGRAIPETARPDPGDRQQIAGADGAPAAGGAILSVL